MIKMPVASACKKGYAEEVVKAADWVALGEEKASYKFSNTVVVDNVTAGGNVVFELINNDPVLFSKYGFAIADAEFTSEKIKLENNKSMYKNYATLTLYAVEQPAEDVNLTIAVEF